MYVWLAMSFAISITQLLVTTQPEWIVNRDKIQVRYPDFEFSTRAPILLLRVFSRSVLPGAASCGS